MRVEAGKLYLIIGADNRRWVVKALENVSAGTSPDYCVSCHAVTGPPGSPEEPGHYMGWYFHRFRPYGADIEITNIA